jgi:hypothetical protein
MEFMGAMMVKGADRDLLLLFIILWPPITLKEMKQ